MSIVNIIQGIQEGILDRRSRLSTLPRNQVPENDKLLWEALYNEKKAKVFPELREFYQNSAKDLRTECMLGLLYQHYR
jgi:hypothetical protein